MKTAKININYQIVFNNTGLEWTDLQNAIIEGIEEYGALHCIGRKYNELVTGKYVIIKDIHCLLYFKVNIENLEIDVTIVEYNGIL